MPSIVVVAAAQSVLNHRPMLSFVDFLIHGLFGIKPPFGIRLEQPLRTTTAGLIGCGLQWFSIGLIAWYSAFPAVIDSYGVAITIAGTAAVLAGLTLALRHGVFGPLVIIPGLSGRAILLLLGLVFFPLRFFVRDGSN
jgi:hypothetical protein